MKRSIIFLLSIVMIVSVVCSAKSNIRQVKSPDDNITVQFKLKEGNPFYRIFYKDAKVVKWSGLGFKFENSAPLNSDLTVISTQTESVKNKWEPVWGQKDTIINNYREYTINLQEPQDPTRQISLIFRAYNDGVGFRYSLPKRKNFQHVDITSEQTEFNLANIDTCWWIPAHNDSYERKYNTTSLQEIEAVSTPVTMRTDNDLYLSLHEADLTNYAGMKLISKDGDNKLHSDLVPWPNGIKVKADLPLKTPWRTIQIGERPGELVESDLIVNLNDPNKISNTDWIKPMKYVGIWWAMHINKGTWEEGPDHSATTENAKRYIDFVHEELNSENQNIGLLVEGWNKGWNGNWIENGDLFDFTESYPDYDLEEVVNYCEEKGVEYIVHNETGGDIPNYEEQLEEAYDYYQELGIHAIKSGYVADTGIHNPPGQHHHGQYMINHYQKAVRKAAEHEIMINMHEPIKPTGVYRTYPNWVTREGVRGMEYNAWASPNPPEHTTILPFTRILGGPVDYTPGIFDLTFDKYNEDNRVHTTLAKQLAYYVVLYSPMQMAADLVENYEGEPGFQFIEDVPSDWDDTKVLDSEIGDYVIMARKAGEEWYLGGVTDKYPRKIDISLDFLPQETYQVTIYSDSINTGVYENPSSLEIGKYKVRNNDELNMALSTSGGIAIRIEPLEKDWEQCKLEPIQSFNKTAEKKYKQFQTYELFESEE